MKIMENGVVRDMTPEEEAEFLRWHENVPPPGSELDDTEALAILLGGADA